MKIEITTKRFSHLKVFIHDPNKKSWGILIKEMMLFSFKKKALPVDYIRKFLYRTDIKNPFDYLSLREYYAIIESKKVVFPEVTALLHHKLSFKLTALKYNLKTQELLSYNIKKSFFCDSKQHIVENQEQLIKFFKVQFKTSNLDTIFLKPITGVGGFGCFLIQKDTFESQLKIYGEALLGKSYIHEAYIEQHSDISNIYANAVNTLRIVHYTDKHKKIHILASFMRFGTGNSITDNTSAGGFFISVNSETGILEGIGRQEISRGAGIFTRHPNSHFKLEGFKVPYFKEACDLVKAYATFFPNRIVGWDVAITSQGPVMIEGNHNPGLHVSDMAYGGLLKHPLFKEILDEINTQ